MMDLLIRNNLVQYKVNDVKGINGIAILQLDTITLCERMHVWQITNETWVDDYGKVSYKWFALHGQKGYDSGTTLIRYWRMNQGCLSEEMPSKCKIMEAMYNGYKMVSTLVYLYG
jgi:hypothetical protein